MKIRIELTISVPQGTTISIDDVDEDIYTSSVSVEPELIVADDEPPPKIPNYDPEDFLI